MLNWRAAAADLRAGERGWMSARIPLCRFSPGPATGECTGNPRTVSNLNPRAVGHLGWTGFRDTQTSPILCKLGPHPPTQDRRNLKACHSESRALSAVCGAGQGGIWFSLESSAQKYSSGWLLRTCYTSGILFTTAQILSCGSMLPHLRVENCVSENVCELSKFTELVRGMELGSGPRSVWPHWLPQGANLLSFPGPFNLLNLTAPRSMVLSWVGGSPHLYPFLPIPSKTCLALERPVVMVWYIVVRFSQDLRFPCSNLTWTMIRGGWQTKLPESSGRPLPSGRAESSTYLGVPYNNGKHFLGVSCTIICIHYHISSSQLSTELGTIIMPIFTDEETKAQKG